MAVSNRDGNDGGTRDDCAMLIVPRRTKLVLISRKLTSTWQLFDRVNKKYLWKMFPTANEMRSQAKSTFASRH
jgi:hypothetical protein